MFSGLRSLEKTDFYIQTVYKLKLKNCLVTSVHNAIINDADIL